MKTDAMGMIQNIPAIVQRAISEFASRRGFASIPAAYPQTRRSERSMNLQMYEGLQLKSGGFPFKGGTAGRRPDRRQRGFRKLVPRSFPARPAGDETNVSSANYWAVANGAGIRVFQAYACAWGQNNTSRERIAPAI